MHVALPRRRGRLLLLGVASAAVLAGPSAAMASTDAVFTQTNDPAGNMVQRFDRAADGRLTAAGTYATGGAGLATLGGRQGAVELSEDGDTVYAVNAGSNTVTAFRVSRHGLAVAGTVPSGGTASCRARSAPPRCRSPRTAPRWWSPSGSPTGSRRCRSTGRAVPARR
jgi:lactonase family protein with 7-bladed beta-propeller